jgi:biotin carboxyl carrier protein
MQFEIEVAGRTRQVIVTRTGAAFAVSVDGRVRHVDAARLDACGEPALSLILDNVWSYEVGVATDPGTGQMTVTVDGTPVPAIVNGRRRGRRGEAGPGGDGPQRITAPMPGKIVRVLVAAGAAVRARQPLVVVEAMKMENELRAGRDGTVADLPVREGQSVEAGALLVVIQ